MSKWVIKFYANDINKWLNAFHAKDKQDAEKELIFLKKNSPKFEYKIVEEGIEDENI